MSRKISLELLNDGGNAAYSSGSGSTALVFSHTVQAGQNVADLAVTSLSLNGATVKDTAGNLANTVAAAGYNPAGTLRIDTNVPTVSSIAASGSSSAFPCQFSLSSTAATPFPFFVLATITVGLPCVETAAS